MPRLSHVLLAAALLTLTPRAVAQDGPVDWRNPEWKDSEWKDSESEDSARVEIKKMRNHL